MSNIEDKSERIKISFLGIKVECANPTPRGMIVILMFMIFFVVVAVLLKEHLPRMIMLSG
ncbi:hypothetical protein [Taibaiella chishuiensis]|uniref:Uncharacterized protein n=1 Tax=Taibaiella chishuiensis TaxID=1434707 RepID=A0A2P8CPH9_9BACT|nr:hypothetical protein [Taibaiella chishuiensis]PSK86877.1 hypothetical protein B0I18_1193 [Taibaiella chishuiensis]